MHNHSEKGIEMVSKMLSILGIELMMPILKRFPRETIIKIQKYAEENKNITKSDALEILTKFNTASRILVDSASGLNSLINEYDEAKLQDSPEGLKRRMLVGFMKLDDQSAEKIYEIIQNEDPVYRVVILKELSPTKSQAVFALFTAEEKAEFTVESYQTKEASDQVLAVISNNIENKLNAMLGNKHSNFDHAITLASSLSDEELDDLLGSLPEDIAETIRQKAITFTDIMAQNEQVLQIVLSNFGGSAIALAIHPLSESDREKVMACITPTKRDEVEFNLESIQPEQKKEILAAQQSVVAEAKNLQSTGAIEIVK